MFNIFKIFKPKNNFSELRKHLFHSIAIYAASNELPRLLHIGDIIDSAADNNIARMKKDMEVMMVMCMCDIIKAKLNLIKDKQIKSKIDLDFTKASGLPNPINSKMELVKVLNEINKHIGHDEVIEL